jgi:dTDP-4-amino-4,6-dideoxygalactose transaminase
VSWRIPLADVELSDADLDAVADCLRSGWITMGPRTAELERALAEGAGSAHAVAVSSGSAALHLACAALGLGPGDEVIVPAFTFVATAHAPRYSGAVPVLCDVQAADAPTLACAEVERRLTPRTRAVIAVHMCGYAADVGPLRELCDERGLVLIEDAAQAFDARVPPEGACAGTVGAAGCLSFFSKAQLGIGEGGAVLTDDAEVAAGVRRLRSHAMTSGTWDRHRGHEDSYDVVGFGFNFRLDEPRAALALSRLGVVGDAIERRRAVVRRYREALRGVDGVTLMWDDAAVEAATHFAFPVLLESRAARDRVRAELARDGIETTCYPALFELREYASYGSPERLPNAASVSARHVALPLSSRLRPEQVDAVVDAVRAAA